MKSIVSSVIVLSVVLLVASSCFFSETSEETATLKLVIAKNRDTSPASSYDCYAVNVVGPAIKSFDSRYPIPSNDVIANTNKFCHYPGISSKLVGLQNDEANIEVGVPIGNPRLIQVVGMNLKSGFTTCPAGTFAEIWKGKIDDKDNNFPEIDNDQIFEVGKKVIDLRPGTRELQLEISQITDPNLNHFGKTYCDPPSSGGGSASSGGLTFTTFTTNVLSKRSLKNYLSPNTGAYSFTISDGVTNYTPTDDTLLLGTTATAGTTFGGTETDLTVSISEIGGTGKTGTGLIRVRGSHSDPSLFFWLTNDLVTGNFSSWQSLKSYSGALAALAVGGTVTPIVGPDFVPVAKFEAGGLGQLSTSFSPTGDIWDKSAFFIMLKADGAAAGNRVFCFSKNADNCLRPPTGSTSYYVEVRTVFDNGNTVFETEGCIGCSDQGNYVLVKTGPISSQYYVLGIALDGSAIRTSLAPVGTDNGIPSNNTEMQAGSFVNNLISPPGGLYLSKAGNPNDMSFGELLIYRHVLNDNATYDPKIPCNYFKAKYKANLNCTYLENGSAR